MFNIRNEIFETNSSSSHALCMNKNDERNYHFYDTDDEDFIIFTMGEYGWYGDDCDSPQEKLNYLLTMVVCSLQANSEAENSEVTVKEIIESDDFKKIDECIRSNTSYSGICFPQDKYDYNDGYIDHQSMYSHIDDFLNDWNVSLEDYLFSDRYFVVIRNDNESW